MLNANVICANDEVEHRFYLVLMHIIYVEKIGFTPQFPLSKRDLNSNSSAVYKKLFGLLSSSREKKRNWPLQGKLQNSIPNTLEFTCCVSL